MPASYPSAIKSFTAKTDLIDDVMAVDVNEIQDEVAAIEGELGLLGWSPYSSTWTYASATTFTVSGDQTARFRTGTKIKLTQTTVKYFYVLSSSYAAPNTTVTITGGSDYSLANAAITSPNVSYMENPYGFPHWFNYASTVKGETGTIGTYAETVYTSKFCIFSGISYGVKISKKITNLGSWGGRLFVAKPLPVILYGDTTYSGGEVVSKGAIARKAILHTYDWSPDFMFESLVEAGFLQFSGLAVDDYILINGIFFA